MQPSCSISPEPNGTCIASGLHLSYFCLDNVTLILTLIKKRSIYVHLMILYDFTNARDIQRLSKAIYSTIPHFGRSDGQKAALIPIVYMLRDHVPSPIAQSRAKNLSRQLSRCYQAAYSSSYRMSTMSTPQSFLHSGLDQT